MTKKVAEELIEKCNHYIGKTFKRLYDGEKHKIIDLKIVEFNFLKDKEWRFEAICVFEQNEKGIKWTNLLDVYSGVEAFNTYVLVPA